MITLDKFEGIKTEVETSVEKAYTDIRKKSLEYYALLLAKADYDPIIGAHPSCYVNPHLIETIEDSYEDQTRNEFMVNFLNKYYSFKDFDKIDDDSNRIYLELMIYSHIWESSNHLKLLYRITHLLKGERYTWTVKLPENGKEGCGSYIHDNISKPLIEIKNSLGTIIRKTFNSSIRNAFAHSKFNFEGNFIKLYNYDEKSKEPWSLDQLSFDDWSERFTYSFLLSYNLFRYRLLKKNSFVEDTGTSKVQINLPKLDGSTKMTEIQLEDRPIGSKTEILFRWKDDDEQESCKCTKH